MSCNCPDTNKCPTPTTCLCGFETNIYNSEGLLIETVTAYPIDVEGTTIYQVFNSTAFEPMLGQSYTLTIAYNYELERWEMTYFNNDLELTIVLGVLYGIGPDDCPISNCWDLDCIAVGFFSLGLFSFYFSWDGGYTNGKKSYTFSGAFTPYTEFRLYWTPDASTIPGSGAPIGTPAWVFEGSNTPGIYIPISYYFSSNQCPYGPYIFEYDNPISRMEFQDFGVTGFDLKTTILDCGCCDTEVIINIEGEEYTATVEYDEYGNVLVYGGVNYYTFEIGENTYYLFYVNGEWVVKEELSESAETISSLTSTNECPYGYYINNNTLCDCIEVTIEAEPSPVSYTANAIGTYGGFNVYSFLLEEFTIYIWYSEGDGWVMTIGGYGEGEFSSIATSTFQGSCPDSINEGFLWNSVLTGGITTENCSGLPAFDFVFVKGVKCFDCCDYDTPQNRNLLKKKKAIFVDEISSIRSKEIFGFNCGPEWDDLFKKHLIFDVLWCLPYGKICDEEQQCLINNLNENCNC